MAIKCPNCGKTLHWYDFRAECKYCGANIPNYDWEGRLEQDADIAETSFARLHYHLDNFKSATVGSPLRIVRLVCTLLPLVALVVPLLNATFAFPFYAETKSISFLTFVLDYLTKFDIGSVLSLAGGEILGGVITSLLLACLFALLAVAAGVVNFFVVLFGRYQPALAAECHFEYHQLGFLVPFRLFSQSVYPRRVGTFRSGVLRHGFDVDFARRRAVPFGPCD